MAEASISGGLDILTAVLDKQADTLAGLMLRNITRQQGLLEEYLSRTPVSRAFRSAHRPWYPGGQAVAGRRIAELWSIKAEGQPTGDGRFFPVLRIRNPHVGARPWLFGRPAVHNVRPRYPNPELPRVQWRNKFGKPINRVLEAGRIPWTMALTTRYGYARRPGNDATYDKMMFAMSYDLPAVPPNERAYREITNVVGEMGQSATAQLVKDGLLSALREAMGTARGESP